MTTTVTILAICTLIVFVLVLTNHFGYTDIQLKFKHKPLKGFERRTDK